VVLALDAFEHFDDDVGAMKETYRVLRPGGVLVATVPAFMSLWSPHDDAYHHRRRYRRPQFRARLREAGFHVERVSYSTMTLFPAVFALRRWRRMTGGDDVTDSGLRSPTSDFAVRFPAPVEALAGAITSAEVALQRRVNLPFGVSLCAVLRTAGGWARLRAARPRPCRGTSRSRSRCWLSPPPASCPCSTRASCTTTTTPVSWPTPGSWVSRAGNWRGWPAASCRGTTSR
jgi:hypothetical protein